MSEKLYLSGTEYPQDHRLPNQSAGALQKWPIGSGCTSPWQALPLTIHVRFFPPCVKFSNYSRSASGPWYSHQDFGCTALFTGVWTALAASSLSRCKILPNFLLNLTMSLCKILHWKSILPTNLLAITAKIMGDVSLHALVDTWLWRDLAVKS